MAKPLIGITTYPGLDQYGHPTNYQLSEYIHALRDAGGLPVLIPLELPGDDIKCLVDRLDGVLFSGGGDIEIEHYNGIPHEKIYNVEPERDRVELSILQHVVEGRKPFFGICRGIQVLNVGLGGSLFTHIPDQLGDLVPHPQDGKLDRRRRVHSVHIERDSRLARILDCETLMVNSIHHQGIKDLAPGLTATAFAEDGLVEGVELNEYPFGIAVQWHPEWLAADPDGLLLFKAFVNAAAS